ncbi:helix-turn-helix domain-containing protein [Streptomyces kronopolitis]|uniref:helix-turn-helix domain-containing protein n=1 Tax=Streptomyces kronopolitis TaxID=1612435 RepID=UPI003D994746
MPQASSGLADNLRAHRRAAGLNQEQLADRARLSTSVIRKLEQGGAARVETLHQIAAALEIPTSALFAADTPTPVVGDESNRQMLAPLRKALMPPVGISDYITDPGDAGNEIFDPSAIMRRVEDGLALHAADRYDSVARILPPLLTDAEAAVAAAESDEARTEAVTVRSRALLLSGKFLTQVRQYDMAYHSLSEGIRLAREVGNRGGATAGVIGMCWLLLRQDRFDEAERLASVTADEVEPRMSSATPGELAAWGELALRIASAAIRNNRPDEAQEGRRMAATAAGALGQEYQDNVTHWARFGPATIELKSVEDLALADDSRGVLRRADDGVLSSKSMRRTGKPTATNWNRHRLDVAQAYVRVGSTQDALDELLGIRRRSPHWITHQPMARYVMTDLLKTRKRTLTKDMRDMAAHLAVQA